MGGGQKFLDGGWQESATKNAIDNKNVLETLLQRTTWQPSIGFPVILVGSWGVRYDLVESAVCNRTAEQKTNPAQQGY